MKVSPMRTSVLVRVTALAVVAACFTALAKADPPKAKSRTLDQDEVEKYVVVTGSYIPQKVRRKSIGTDSVHNVRIYTRNELESTGRTPSVAGGLSLDPSISISGR